MQWDKLASMQYWRVRVDPVSGRAVESGVLACHDYDWIVRHVEKGRSAAVISGSSFRYSYAGFSCVLYDAASFSSVSPLRGFRLPRP
jgi:hypothetical protein